MQSNKIKISIITVVYNNQETLERTIKSVVNQGYDNLEYIIIDGGSTDGTLDIIKKHEHEIDYWISEPDKGIFDAMNKGIKVATGELIGIINSDDWYAEETVEKVAQAYRESGADVIYGNMMVAEEKDNTYWLRECEISTENKIKDLKFSHPTLFVKKSVYDKYGAFNTEFVIEADMDFILRLLNKGLVFYKINKVIAYFALGGLTSKFSLAFNWTRITDRYKILTRNNTPKVEKWNIVIRDFLRFNAKALFKSLGLLKFVRAMKISQHQETNSYL